MPTIDLKAFLVNLYPELRRFNPFKQIGDELLPHIDPRMKKVLRFSLPVFILVIVLGIGLPIGSYILSLVSPRIITPPPIVVNTPPTVPTYQSQFLRIKQTIMDFNPSLPDPVPPVVEEKILLETVEQ